MDALLVWDTWRRLLTDDDLVEWVSHPGSPGGAPLGVSEEEAAVLVDYATTPEATSTNIGMYRRGLVRNALGALDLVPLTRTLLRGSDLDDEVVAEEFSRASGYADHGPRFWHAAAGFVDFLAGLPDFASPPHQDVLALDRATIALALRLGMPHRIMWPGRADGDAVSTAKPERERPARFVASSAATTVSTSCDITAWIVDPFDFDPAEPLEPVARSFLVYFPSAEAAPEFAAVTARAARTFEVLSSPHDIQELSTALDGLSPTDMHGIVEELAALGVVAETPKVEASETR